MAFITFAVKISPPPPPPQYQPSETLNGGYRKCPQPAFWWTSCNIPVTNICLPPQLLRAALHTLHVPAQCNPSCPSHACMLCLLPSVLSPLFPNYLLPVSGSGWNPITPLNLSWPSYSLDLCHYVNFHNMTVGITYFAPNRFGIVLLLIMDGRLRPCFCNTIPSPWVKQSLSPLPSNVPQSPWHIIRVQSIFIYGMN